MFMKLFALVSVFLCSATAGAQDKSSDVWARQVGSAKLRLIDVSLDVLLAGGWSSENDLSLQNLQGGGHDPRKRGFTMQNVELSLMGAVDPYFRGEAHLIYFLDPLSGESIFELEEAFLTTQSLPLGLEIKAGQFFTEFGRLNPTHPHTWRWLDQPLINTRLFGPDGMRGPGLRVSWLIPVSWFSDLYGGVQNANGETMASFLATEEFYDERPIGRRPFFDREVKTPKDLVYLGRWENGFDLTDNVSTKWGLSGLFGPNASGTVGRTAIYGTDFVAKWRPPRTYMGWPFVTFETEWMWRDFEADAAVDNTDPTNVINLPEQTLHDWGVYAQLLYGFTVRWVTGLRYEYATGKSDSIGGRQNDPFRADRQRLSPLIAWHPTEFSRLRLQYNYDRTDSIKGKDAHSVWLGAEFLYGSHPTHKY